MSKKLESLRAEMAKQNIDGFFVPRADEFQGEYVPASAERLKHITEFTGSAGSAVILKDKAAFFTDGRYTLQAREQVDAKDFDICSVSDDQLPTPTISPTQWIEKNLPQGGVFGIDPWVHTPSGVKSIREAVAKADGTLKYLDSNPLDASWEGRPAAPQTPAVAQPLEFSGVGSGEKRDSLAQLMRDKNIDALAVTLPEEVCWLLNVRGNDVPCTPFVLSYAILHKDGGLDWFVDDRKLSQETRDWIDAGAGHTDVHGLKEFAGTLATLAKTGAKIWVDPAASPAAATEIIETSGGAVHSERSPIQLKKAIKNNVEIEGMINAHIRDGVAETRFLAAITAPGAAAKLDELSASDLLEKFRAEGAHFKGLSFDTISGAGGNGAIVHYRSSPETNKPLLAGPVYLVDSGAQYLDGTTDITRTVAVDPDKLTPEMKDRFTRVLKGHIQVAMSEFPEGTVGKPLDDKARASLKDIGLDYAHGTGHGVGSYLSVHEGPAGIHARATTVPLEPGMIISNEPGFYKEGEFGIRIESLVLVVDTGKKDADDKRLFGFKTITQAPIDRNLIEPSLLDDAELKWLNAYHADVKKTLEPLLAKIDPPVVAYLQEATAPVEKATPSAQPKKRNGFFL